MNKSESAFDQSRRFDLQPLVVFSSLRQVVSFYATRGSDPKRWYPSGTFDDLPAKYQKYVNTNAAPYNRGVGETVCYS